MNAYLLLANGMVFAGQSVGAEGVTVGEVVFATGMVGFEEPLTDPRYYGQIITQTYPLIGNYGMNKDDMESDRIWAKGYIVREACTTPSNWRCPLLPSRYSVVVFSASAIFWIVTILDGLRLPSS